MRRVVLGVGLFLLLGALGLVIMLARCHGCCCTELAGCFIYLVAGAAQNAAYNILNVARGRVNVGLEGRGVVVGRHLDLCVVWFVGCRLCCALIASDEEDCLVSGCFDVWFVKER